MGLVQCDGELRFRDRSLAGLRTFEIARLGIGYVPEHRDVFPTLSVGENLELGVGPGNSGNIERNRGRAPRFTIDDAYALFLSCANAGARARARCRAASSRC